jgi:hypothetical protein
MRGEPILSSSWTSATGGGPGARVPHLPALEDHARPYGMAVPRLDRSLLCSKSPIRQHRTSRAVFPKKKHRVVWLAPSSLMVKLLNALLAGPRPFVESRAHKLKVRPSQSAIYGARRKKRTLPRSCSFH